VHIRLSLTTSSNTALHRTAAKHCSFVARVRASHGRVSGQNGAAKRLGLPHSTLEFRIKKLGIDKFQFRRKEAV
jgi:formate hydrogenlyase transcriptional activator